MRIKAFHPAMTVLFAAVAYGQSPADQSVERALHFTSTPSAQGLQEIATIMRTVADFRDVSVEPTQVTVTVRGSAAQIAVAEWLAHELDQEPDLATHQYQVPGNTDDVVRVFYLTHTPAPQGVQEILTVLRTVGDVRKVFNYSSTRALALRGPSGQTAMADWLIHELDKPAADETTGTHQYVAPDRNGDVLRIVYLAHAGTPQGLQQILTAVRTKVRIQKAFVCTARSAEILRGSAEQIAAAERLIVDMDKPAAQ